MRKPVEIPEFTDPVDQANQWVALLTLFREWHCKDKAKKCGCSACRGDYGDALDQMDWATGEGRWKARVVGTVAKRGVTYRLLSNGKFEEL